MARTYYKVKRGMVFWYEPPKHLVKTSMQQGRRPWVVVSNDEGNISAPTCNIAPLTAEDKTDIPVHVKTYLFGIENIVLCEQITTVDQSVLKEYYCSLTDDTMKKVEEAIAIQYSISPIVKYMDFNMSNLVTKLEGMIEGIIRDKVQKQSQVVAYDDLEDSALRLGQLIEDLMGTSIKAEAPNKQPTPAPKLTPKPIQKSPTVSPASAKEVEKAVVKEEPKKPQQVPQQNIASQQKGRQKQKWTVESRCEFLRDCDTMSPEDVKEKYGFTAIGSVFATKYNCKNILKEMGVDYKNGESISRAGTESN